MSIKKEDIASGFKMLQNEICDRLEQEDGRGKFLVDNWERPGGGGGSSRIMANGKVIEKGGVNFSEVGGKTPQRILDALKLPESDFYATGVSIIMHPYNPWVPIIHMNVRYFEMSDGTWWFGGGIDLTPHYVNCDEAKHFHLQIKKVCDQHDELFYPKFKKWADDYFYIKHRKETRGIGGIFFDHMNESAGFTKENLYHFVSDIGHLFAPLYCKLISENKNKPYGDEEKQWQFVRRGRYVEFNLVYDKGTKFGLDTEGRIESVLMSLPPLASWVYNYQPPKGSPEAKTLSLLKKDLNWIDMKE